MVDFSINLTIEEYNFLNYFFEEEKKNLLLDDVGSLFWSPNPNCMESWFNESNTLNL